MNKRKKAKQTKQNNILLWLRAFFELRGCPNSNNNGKGKTTTKRE